MEETMCHDDDDLADEEEDAAIVDWARANSEDERGPRPAGSGPIPRYSRRSTTPALSGAARSKPGARRRPNSRFTPDVAYYRHPPAPPKVDPLSPMCDATP